MYPHTYFHGGCGSNAKSDMWLSPTGICKCKHTHWPRVPCISFSNQGSKVFMCYGSHQIRSSSTLMSLGWGCELTKMPWGLFLQILFVAYRILSQGNGKWSKYLRTYMSLPTSLLLCCELYNIATNVMIMITIFHAVNPFSKIIWSSPFHKQDDLAPPIHETFPISLKWVLSCIEGVHCRCISQLECICIKVQSKLF